jgi:hypothetical protein
MVSGFAFAKLLAIWRAWTALRSKAEAAPARDSGECSSLQEDIQLEAAVPDSPVSLRTPADAPLASFLIKSVSSQLSGSERLRVF